MAIPAEFNEAFLLWFRERTEATWKKYPHHSIASLLEQERIDGGRLPTWQRGTKWLDPLSEEELDALEEQWHVRFPPDYRLLFKWLHATDRPQVGLTGEGDDLKLETFSPCLFHNWQKEPDSITWAYEHILGGFAFDAIHNSFWRAEWGSKPATKEEARARLVPLLDAVPKMLPLYGHRYLLADPCQAANPVFSIWQSDIIIYGHDLRTYLLHEWGRSYRSAPSLLRLTSHDQKVVNEEYNRLMTERQEVYQAIPFWGDFLFFGEGSNSIFPMLFMGTSLLL